MFMWNYSDLKIDIPPFDDYAIFDPLVSQGFPTKKKYPIKSSIEYAVKMENHSKLDYPPSLTVQTLVPLGFYDQPILDLTITNQQSSIGAISNINETARSKFGQSPLNTT